MRKRLTSGLCRRRATYLVTAALLVAISPTATEAAGLTGPWRSAGSFPDTNANLPGYPLNNCRSQHTAGLTDEHAIWVVAGAGCVTAQQNILAGPSWTILPGYHTGRYMTSALAKFGSRFFEVGANLNSGRSDLIYWISPRASTFDYGVAGALPLGLSSATASIHDGWLYVTGGESDVGARPDVWAAEVSALGAVGQFRGLAPLPGKRSSHQALVVRDRLYIIGGSDHPPGAPAGGSSDTVWYASILPNGTLGPWQQGADLPVPLTDHSAVAIGDDIYVIGGVTPSGVSSNTYHTSTDPLSGAIGGWETSAYTLPDGPRRGHAAVARGSDIVVTGGNGHPDVIEVTTSSQPSDFELLDRYRPELRYDVLETYRADSAAMMTDNCVMNGSRVGRQNRLKDDRGKTKAAACPADRADDLSLDYLGAHTAEPGDHLDADNEYAQDAVRLHAQGPYAHRSYGRVVRYADGYSTLQYWYFYYHNPKNYPIVGGQHEGDWETVAVHLDPAGNPRSATYSQHAGAETCEWEHVQRTLGERPIVYVAEGSHANYFSSGYHFNEGANDTANGDGEWVTPAVQDVTPVPAWMLWSGRWGGSDSSPSGPPLQGVRWVDPLLWGFTEDGCTEQQTQSGVMALRSQLQRHPVPSGSPRLPRVSAQLVGRAVRIKYAFRRGVLRGRQRPKLLLTSVDVAGTRYPPVTVRTRIRARYGVARSPVGPGRGKAKVRIAVESKNGVRSRVVSVPVR